MAYVCAGLIGLLVGVCELVSRYRDAPVKAVLTLPAFVYVALNVGASITALYLIRVFGWDLGIGTDGGTDRVAAGQVLVAGLGAMALFRSSLFNAKIGDGEIGIGPSSLLQILQGAADRAVDRARAEKRAEAVARIMKDVSFAKAQVVLPTVCLALMQNLPLDVQESLANEVLKLQSSEMEDQAKALNLGLVLTKYVGEEVLESAVKSLEGLISPG